MSAGPRTSTYSNSLQRAGCHRSKSLHCTTTGLHGSVERVLSSPMLRYLEVRVYLQGWIDLGRDELDSADTSGDGDLWRNNAAASLGL
jgi:hypothetical protein